MVQVLRTWVRPEHIEAYRTLVKSDTLPAIKKSGAKMYSVGHVRVGGANQEYSSVIALDNWAALDGVMPIVTGLGGQAAYDKFLTKLRTLDHSQRVRDLPLPTEPELPRTPEVNLIFDVGLFREPLRARLGRAVPVGLRVVVTLRFP